MNDSKIGIAGTGYYLPEKILTNADLEKMVDTSDEWILGRTGIKERRIAGDEDTVSSMAEAASRHALKSAGLEGKELELIILATFTPDNPLPASACLLQARWAMIPLPVLIFPPLAAVSSTLWRWLIR